MEEKREHLIYVYSEFKGKECRERKRTIFDELISEDFPQKMHESTDS